MRFDPATGKYSPGTAQSLEPNADFSVWTLKLRPGIKFTDGTGLDAEAVKFNIERHVAPGSKSNYVSQVGNNVKSMEVVDPLTVRFNLTSPLASFPYILAVGPGDDRVANRDQEVRRWNRRYQRCRRRSFHA